MAGYGFSKHVQVWINLISCDFCNVAAIGQIGNLKDKLTLHFVQDENRNGREVVISEEPQSLVEFREELIRGGWRTSHLFGKDLIVCPRCSKTLGLM